MKYLKRAAGALGLTAIWLGAMELGYPGWTSLMWFLLRGTVMWLLRLLFAAMSLAGGP